jgi:signal transduction histidine kinase
MNPVNLGAFFVSLGVGCVVLYANPKRGINRAFFLASLTVCAWLASLEWLTNPANPNPELWIRITSAIGAFIPSLLWMIKDCAEGGNFGWGSLKRGGWAWLLAGLSIAVLCFTYWFIPAESTREHHLRGVGWNTFAVVNAASYIILFIQAINSLRTRAGIQKLELQALVFGGTAAGFVAVALSTLGTNLNIPSSPKILPMVIVVFYSFTAWGITTQKIFDARDIFRSGIQIALSMGIVAVIVGVALEVDPLTVPRTLVVISCAALITLIFRQFNSRILRATQMGGDRESEAIRTAILAAGRDEFDHNTLVRRFSRILGDWAGVEHAYFLNGEKDSFKCGTFTMEASSAAGAELLSAKWATPESLQRQRDAGGRRELLKFMKEQRLGVMICAPSDEGLAPFIIALEIRRSRAPFTWSEVKLLQEWTAVIENILSRINLTQHARESEQLRTAGLLGASLAHEIRNPLVTIKTIAQSASTRFNDPEFRRLLIDLVPTEIERIEGLVSGLMDLGRPQHPHFERFRLNEIVETSVKLVRPKAQDESVDLSCALDASPDIVNADRASIRQVILNLVMNAIQAVSVIEGRREVSVRTSGGEGSVILEVGDNGPGMPVEVRERLFQPFTTSNKTSGIGLGLAITADLVKLHHGQIALVDAGEVGTTFRVTLPCRQPI